MSIVISKSSATAVTYQKHYRYCYAPQTIPGWPQTFNSSVTTFWSRREYDLTPNYWLLRKRGLTIPYTKFFSYLETKDTPFTITSEVREASCSPWQYWSTYNSFNGVMDVPVNYPFDIIDTIFKTRVDNLATSKLLSRIKNQKINIAIASAEMKSTLRTITSAAETLAKSFLYLKRGNLKRAYNELGLSTKRRQLRSYKRAHADDPKIAAENEWLAMRYGWLPLLSDIHGAAEALADSTEPIMRNRVESVATMTLEQTFTDQSMYNGWYGWVSTNKVVARHTSKYVCYMVSSSSAPTATSLGITNPLALAYELIPFSFVLDWFYPIGNALNNIDATVGQQFAGGTKTHFTKHEFQATHSGKYVSLSEGNFTGTAVSSRTKVNCVRTELAAFPAATMPEFRSPLSLTHAIDAITLLKTVFK